MNAPPRRLGTEHDPDTGDARTEHLQPEREAPVEVTHTCEVQMSAVDGEGGDDAAHVPSRVVQTGDGASILRRRDLNEVKGRRGRREGAEERKQESASGENWDCFCGRDNDCADYDTQAADENDSLAALPVGHPDEQCAGHLTDLYFSLAWCSIEDSEFLAWKIAKTMPVPAFPVAGSPKYDV